MKKIIVIGMAVVILCTSMAFGVYKKVNDDKVENAVDYTLAYIDEKYGDEGYTTEAIDLNNNNREVLQTLFDCDLAECEAVVVIYDVYGNINECISVALN